MPRSKTNDSVSVKFRPIFKLKLEEIFGETSILVSGYISRFDKKLVPAELLNATSNQTYSKVVWLLIRMLTSKMSK